MKHTQRTRAYALVLEGYPIRKVAREVGVSRSTVERWCVKGDWIQKRKQAHQEALARYLNQHQTHWSDLLFKNSLDILSIIEEAIAEHRAYLSGHIKWKSLRFKPSHIGALALAFGSLQSAEYMALCKKI